MEVGNGKNSEKTIVDVIYKPEEDKKEHKTVTYKSNDTNVVVSGLEDIKVNLARCCNPVYGDNIVGYITKGSGITVHRAHCHNIINTNERLVDCTWSDNNENVKYLSEIVIYSNSNKDNMIEILESAGDLSIGVKGVKKVYQEDETNYVLECYVTSKKQLDSLITDLRNKDFVEDAERIIH